MIQSSLTAWRHKASQSTPFDDALQNITPNDREDVRSLRYLLRQLTPAMTVRIGLLLALPRAIHGFWPERLAEIDALPACLPTRPTLFTWGSVGWVLVMLAQASHVIWPGRPLREGSAEIVEQSAETLAQHPLMRTVMRACDGDFNTYLRVATRGAWFWGHGEEHAIIHGSNHASIEHRGRHPEVIAWIMPGFVRGVLCMFGLEGDVRFEACAPRVSRIDVRWG